MIKNVVVPLDGSKLAESALQYVEELATRMGVEKVTLLSVTERVQGYRALDDLSSPTEMRLAPEAVGKMEEQASKYLKRIAVGLGSKGIKVETEVLLGEPAHEIAFYTSTPGADLIVMASHGRSGPSRWAHGSVAEKVLKAVCIPVMVVRAPGCNGTL
jgi:nucleotide-binding universal stress UspA family protein